MPMQNLFHFDNSYARLPELFYARLQPATPNAPSMVVFNHALAHTLELNAEHLDSPYGAAILSGKVMPEGATPIAQAYAGHQYGHFTMLGDGRAMLLGEHISRSVGRVDIQLKGSGRTAFSRSGDGMAALGPMLREYLISEAMHALGIPTTRSLAVVATGDPVLRDGLLPGAVLTRVASSHLRVGTFEYLARLGDVASLRLLANYAIQRHYPAEAVAENPYLGLLAAVAERQAQLIAQWQRVGFIHGVMNTDNMAISGETIDYGPCAFMDSYDPATVFSSIDRHGRYAYANQPIIAQWNIARFAEALLPLLHADQHKAIGLAENVIDTFRQRYEQHWLEAMRAKLGLFNREDGDAQLAGTLLAWMHSSKADFTNSFRALSSPAFLHGQEDAAMPWLAPWRARLTRQNEPLTTAAHHMDAHNPAVIPRNHRVEEALHAATHGDMALFHALLNILQHPYTPLGDVAHYQAPPALPDPNYRTFCGT